MRTLAATFEEGFPERLAPSYPNRPATRLSCLHLVRAQELQELRETLARGHLPPDLQSKLDRLSTGGILHSSVARNCRCFAELLLAAHDRSFTESRPSDCERLLRVLAYVRKDDDAIPDYKANGFVDDQQEVRAAADDLGPLLQRFKAWRLRHQVPRMCWS